MSVGPGSPAKECGKIRAGMTLTHVDGEDLSNKDCEAVALLLLGDPGSSVDLSFLSSRTAGELQLLGQETQREGGEEGEDQTFSPRAEEQQVKIDVTLERKDPSECLEEAAEMARFRRLGCARGMATLRA
eukprot:GHVU01056889.1.p1 GENE.GHVU01056889.1~~GHVU01056889.1.p1  ORF type:complete len:130 (+),score=19.75 GHVU01056889.1:632-1021(+)